MSRLSTPFWEFQCDRFILYPNFEIIELNERSYTLKVRRKSDGVVFKIPSLTLAYMFAELEPGINLCEAIILFTAVLAKLGKLTKEDEELLEKDPVALEAKHGEILIDFLTIFGTIPGLIMVQKKD